MKTWFWRCALILLLIPAAVHGMWWFIGFTVGAVILIVLLEEIVAAADKDDNESLANLSDEKSRHALMRKIEKNTKDIGYLLIGMMLMLGVMGGIIAK